MEWWAILLIVLWAASGFWAWLFVVLKFRMRTVGDLIILPFCVMFGPLVWVIYLTATLSVTDHTIWRW